MIYRTSKVLETNCFKNVLDLLSDEEMIKKLAIEFNTIITFGKDRIGEFVLFVVGECCTTVKFYLAEDILNLVDEKYYDKISCKYSRLDYLKDLGVPEGYIVKTKLSKLKMLSRHVYGRHNSRMTVIGPRKCILVHQSAIYTLSR